MSTAIATESTASTQAAPREETASEIYLRREKRKEEIQKKTNAIIQSSEQEIAEFLKTNPTGLITLKAAGAEAVGPIPVRTLAESGLIRTMMDTGMEEGDEMEEGEEREMDVFVQKVSGTQVLRDLVAYCELRNTPGFTVPVMTMPLKTGNMVKEAGEVMGGFIEAIKPDQARLFALVNAANYLEMIFLVQLCCAACASLVKDVPTDDIPALFGAPPITDADRERITKECSMILETP